MMRLGYSRLDIGRLDVDAGGYAIFAAADRVPDPELDTPVAVAASDATAVELNVPFPGKAARMLGLVVPCNDQGDGTPGAPFAFSFDGDGEVDASPAPVSNLRAIALAGGIVELSWMYRDSDLRQKAATFEVTGSVAQSAGGTSSLAALVAAGQLVANRDALRAEYRHRIGPLPAGRLDVSVLSVSPTGAKVANVQAAQAVIDLAAPEDISLVMLAT